MTTKLITLTALAVALSACGSDDLTEGLADAGPIDATPCFTPNTAFFNFAGGDYSAGIDDPAANTSAILSGSQTAAATSLSPTAQADLLSCVRGHLAPFNIDVVDSEPASLPYLEVVVTASRGADLGLANVPVQTQATCSGPRNAVGFVFDGGLNATQLCLLSMFTITTNAGVEIVSDCRDVNYGGLDDCGPRSILDEQVDCGISSPGPCMCGGTTVNPHQKMLEVYGPACQ